MMVSDLIHFKIFLTLWLLSPFIFGDENKTKIGNKICDINRNSFPFVYCSYTSFLDKIASESYLQQCSLISIDLMKEWEIQIIQFRFVITFIRNGVAVVREKTLLLFIIYFLKLSVIQQSEISTIKFIIENRYDRSFHCFWIFMYNISNGFLQAFEIRKTSSKSTLLEPNVIS
jgi:hypothetical protein